MDAGRGKITDIRSTGRGDHFGRRSILVRSAMTTGAVVMLALVLFILFIIPYQRSILRDRMRSTAEVIATSIDQVTVTSIVVEDYSPVIEHCLKVVQERPAVLYLVITRRDGFSLVHQAGGWRFDQLEESWRPQGSTPGAIVDSELAGRKVFHYAYPINYSGIDWGWIHIGLSLDRFEADLRAIYIRTIVLGLLCMGMASIASVFFARRVIRPLLELHRITERIAAGDLEARALIATGDEVESLAHAFNQMTGAVRQARDELEVRVEERTAELQSANARLLGEIQERRRAEEARWAAEDELEGQRSLRMRSDRLRSLGEMAAGIAHELNQPLVGVRGLAEHLLIGMERGWKLDALKLQQRLEGIVEQADRMVHIIEHVRKFAREAGRPELAAVPVNEVVQSALDLLQVQFRSHGLELDAELGEELPLVQANPYSLEEVVLNLLSNARDAVEAQEDEGAGWTGWVKVRTGVEDGWVRIAVADSGVGIPSGVAERVFEPFFTTKDPDRGTGLGLSISKGIVEEFEGRLELASVEGEGTTVTICLPISPETGGSGGENLSA